MCGRSTRNWRQASAFRRNSNSMACARRPISLLRKLSNSLVEIMGTRSELSERIAALSPAKRATLQQKLREKREGSAAAPTGIPRRRVHGPAALSFAQERLWFLTLLDPGSRAYNLRKVYRLKGPLNVVALERS